MSQERLRQTDLALIRGQDVMNGGEIDETSEVSLCDLPQRCLNFGEQVTTTADRNFFWRESLADGIYSLAGVPLRPGTPSRAR
jgi:hypothetical protein